MDESKTAYTQPASLFTAPPHEEPERFELTRRDRIFAALLFAASLFTAICGFWGDFMLGWTISFVLLFSLGTVYVFRKGVRISAFSVTCGVLSVVLSLLFTETTNGSVRFFALVVSIVLMLIWFGTTVSDRTDRGDLGVVETMLSPVVQLGLRHLPTTLRSLFTGNRQGTTLSKILIGVAISVPALGIVVPLLMRSDAAFDGLATMLIDNLSTTVQQVVVGAVLSLVVVPYCFALRHKTLDEAKESRFTGVDGVIIGTVLSLLSVCYLAYLFSQLAYFFSGFGGFLPEGYTFTVAAYARRGFFEMSAIAAINFVILFAAQLLARQRNGKIHVALRALCTFIALFTLMIIATAISKMVLYIDLFGMTVLRVTTTAFMVFLAVVFVSVILRLFTPKVKVLKTAVITAGVVLAVLGLCNVNRAVAAYNYHAYENGWLTTIDIDTICDMGDEGIPYLLKLTYAEDAEIADKATARIDECFHSGTYYMYEIVFTDEEKTTYCLKLGKKTYTKWTQFNLSRQRAYAALEQYIEENPLLFTV